MTQWQRERISETIGVLEMAAALHEGNVRTVLITEAETLQEMLDNDREEL